MSVGTHPLPTLGQGQRPPGSSDPIPRFPRAPTVSDAIAVGASEQSLITERSLDELIVIVGLQQANLPDEAQATTHPSYRGRITGPVKFVNQLLATWHLEPEKACILLGFEHSRLNYVNDVLQGYETLTGRDAKDRIVHLIQIRTSLSALFRDETVENEWLREPHDTLNGKKPMDLLLEGSMENLLLVKEYVELVART